MTGPSISFAWRYCSESLDFPLWKIEMVMMLHRLLRTRRMDWLLLKMVVDVSMMIMAMGDIDPFRLADQVLTELGTSFVDANFPMVR